MNMHTDHNKLITPITLVNLQVSNVTLKPASQDQHYDYTDAAGKVLFTKQRYVKTDGSKSYAYSHVNSEGVTLKTMPPFADGTPLYNLHRFSKYPTSTVYFC